MKFAGAHEASRGVATAFVGVIATDFEAGARISEGVAPEAGGAALVAGVPT